MIIDVLFFGVLLVNMIGWHELGHMIVSDGDVKVGIDKRGVYTEIEQTEHNKRKKKQIAFGGIITGFIPILLCAAVYGYLAFIMILLYLIGVKDDIREILY